MPPYDAEPAAADGEIDAPAPGSAAWWDEHADRLRRRRPRAGGLTVEAIVDAALDLADAEGLDALTVRSLAAALETSSASLYRHVASVDELRVLMVDRVLGELRPSAPSLPPVERIMHRSREFRAALMRHPGVVPALRSAPLLGPNGLAAAHIDFGNYLDAGLPGREAAAAYVAMVDWIMGFVFFATAAGGPTEPEYFADPSDLFGAHRDDFASLAPDSVFEFGLQAFLRGIGLEVR